MTGLASEMLDERRTALRELRQRLFKLLGHVREQAVNQVDLDTLARFEGTLHTVDDEELCAIAESLMGALDDNGFVSRLHDSVQRTH